jgi:hypothetical protein
MFDAMLAIFAQLGSKLLHLFLVIVEFYVLAICGYFASKLLGDILEFFVGVGIAFTLMRVGLVADKPFL